jgi:hypothetical protein
MTHRLMSAIFVSALSASLTRPVVAITVSSSAEVGGPNAAALVGILVDATSAYTVVSGSQNTTINASGSPASNLRALGSFTNGITASGTLLPAANQNANGTAQYAGGIDINAGI